MPWRDNRIQRISGGEGGRLGHSPAWGRVRAAGLRGPEGRGPRAGGVRAGRGSGGERHSKQGLGSPSLAKSGQAAQGPRAEE